MENPFESGHIKNYLLLYGSVVVIMILFFVASSLFNDVETMPKKAFKEGKVEKVRDIAKKVKKETDSRFKLLDKKPTP